MLTKKQFDVLVYMDEQREAVSAQTVAQALMFPIDETEQMLAQFVECGYCEDGYITLLGRSALEPYRVKRAILMAAGFGSRMVPITLNVPKPLVRVNGVRMIDTLLDAILAAGIPEIYIIRGYKADMFDELLLKYPMIRFIENPLYDEGNNIVSVACAGPLIKSAYIMEADLVLSNPRLIRKYQYNSNYLGIPMKKTDDWCLKTTNGYISYTGQGGEDCYQTVGISYWTEADGARLVGHIREVIHSPGGRNRLWGQVPLAVHAEDYKVSVRECRLEDVIEIDTFDELKTIDPTYDI